MTKTSKILLTGDKWGGHQGTTVEATPAAGDAHLSAEGLRNPICMTDCPIEGWTGVEVPYLVGEKVRLTGDKWPDPGTIREISGYWYSSAKEAWLPQLDTAYLVVGDWTVEPVNDFATGGYIKTPRVIAIGSETDPDAPTPLTGLPRVDEWSDTFGENIESIVSEPEKIDPDHYKHYRVEVIELTRDMPFLTGNVVKYVARAPFKGDAVADLRKARKYLDWAIEDAEAGL